jgi:hypothetical protein
MAENVSEALDLGSFVDDRLGGVSPGKEAPAPADESADLDGDVALKPLHELAHRDRRRGTNHCVKMVRGEDVSEELNLALPDGAGEDAAN